MTDTGLAMVYKELNISSRKEISQSQHDSPDIELWVPKPVKQFDIMSQFPL